jgi:hypothetical protein
MGETFMVILLLFVPYHMMFNRLKLQKLFMSLGWLLDNFFGMAMIGLNTED